MNYTIKYSNELYHHGVKGMKWGVRHDRKKATEFNAYRDSNKEIIKNRDGSYTIPNGYKFNRVGQSALDINKSGGLYVSSGKEDAARYVKNLGPSFIGKLMKQYGTTVQHITASKNIRMASEEQTIKMLCKIVDSNPKVQKEFNDSLYSYAFINGKSVSDKKKAFAVSAMLGNGQHNEANSFILSEIRKQGYDAIPDLNDLYTGTGTTSTILINHDKYKITESTQITKDVYKAGKKYAKSLEKLKVDDVINN